MTTRFNGQTLAALATFLLSTSALGAVDPEKAGVALTFMPRAAAPEVTELERATIRGQRFGGVDGRSEELLLADGTSLTLAPGTILTVQDFEFDPDTRAGRLRINMERGILRIGGKWASPRAPIVVETPAGEVELESGGAIVSVEADGTRVPRSFTGGCSR